MRSKRHLAPLMTLMLASPGIARAVLKRFSESPSALRNKGRKEQTK